MTSEELKNLKSRLWQTADQLRAGSGLKSTQYSAPILGLIFLRFADSKYSKYENEIIEEYNKTKGTRAEKQIHEIATVKCGFYLPDNARYDKLLNLPEEENLPLKIKEAMIEIDIFSKIYEYFLGEFALYEGQGGGEFFTPSTVVRYMVEVLAPTGGKILDLACGSGGMFVQTAHYIARHREKHGEDSDINLRANGVEKTGNYERIKEQFTYNKRK